jgi:ketosteroid isomerase-like protein
VQSDAHHAARACNPDSCLVISRATVLGRLPGHPPQTAIAGTVAKCTSASTVSLVSERHASWITAYEAAWRTAGTAPLEQLFTEDATYVPAPFDEPLAGLEAIGRFWEAERVGPDEMFTLDSEIVAAQGDTAVARLEVVYGAPTKRTYRDLWIITLASDGRCRHFEEWPFHPGQARVAP